jgi:hypothetical protein
MWCEFKIRIVDVDEDGQAAKNGESLYTLGMYDMSEVKFFYATKDNRGINCVIVEFYNDEGNLCVYNEYKQVKEMLKDKIYASS